MPKPGLRKIHRYSDEFKATAVKLSSLPEILIQDVAEALDIHPFMLSRWRKEMREGMIMAKPVKLDEGTTAELRRLRTLEREHTLLKLEHALLFWIWVSNSARLCIRCIRRRSRSRVARIRAG